MNDKLKSRTEIAKTIADFMKSGVKGKDIYYTVGYQCLGPLLVGFCQWLKSNCDSKHIDEQLFFARDGFIMQKAYDILFPNSSSSYVYISRRSVTVPQLATAKNWKDVIETIGYVKREETWATLLHKMGIENDDDIVRMLNARYGDCISKEQLLHNLKFAEAFELLKPQMVINAQVEMKEVKVYLDPYFKGKNVGIIDIGWYGTMQQVLNKLYGSSTKINGFYIGLLKREGYSSANMQGYIFDYLQENEYDDKLIYGFNGLIESFFSANHGSTKKYKNGKPILEEWESENWPIISEVHEGALQFCKDILKHSVDSSYFLDKKCAFSALLRFMTKPSQEEVKAFGKIVFFDTYYEPLVRYGGR